MKAIEQLEYAPNTLARNFRTTDRKSFLAFRGIGPESAAESVRFHGRRVTKVDPGVKHGLFRVRRERFVLSVRTDQPMWT